MFGQGFKAECHRLWMFLQADRTPLCVNRHRIATEEFLHVTNHRRERFVRQSVQLGHHSFGQIELEFLQLQLSTVVVIMKQPDRFKTFNLPLGQYESLR